MTPRHFWFTTYEHEAHMTKAEPQSLCDAVVTVRGANGRAHYDGVWVNGKRSWDTFVFIDGVVAYHSPVKDVGTETFRAHEAGGGGHAL